MRDMNFGVLLRRWRTARRVSQLELSLDADISTRHLSCVETGRAKPSREMVVRLAEALQVPLRERNPLLLAAGYAPLYRQTDLDTQELDAARRAVEFLMAQHQPYPVLVMDRHWNTLRMNAGAKRFSGASLAAILELLTTASALYSNQRGCGLSSKTGRASQHALFSECSMRFPLTLPTRR